MNSASRDGWTTATQLLLQECFPEQNGYSTDIRCGRGILQPSFNVNQETFTYYQLEGVLTPHVCDYSSIVVHWVWDGHLL